MFVVILLILIIYWGWSRISGRDSNDEPPMCPGRLPIIGHIHLIVGNSLSLWEAVKELSYASLRLGGVMSAKIGPLTIYVVTDPEDALTVANTCLQKDPVYEFAESWLGEGLITAKLSTWKNHRRLLNPAFSQTVIDSFLGVFNSQSRRLVEDLKTEVGKGPFDHWVYTRHNALETICRTALGIDYTHVSLLNSQYVKAAEKIFQILVDRFQKLWFYSDFTYRFSFLKKEEEKAIEVLHNMSNTVLKKRKADYLRSKLENDDKSETKFKPFMDLMLELAIDKGAFNDREVREHIDTIIVAGHDTSANLLVYALLMIGSRPEVQEKIVDEIRQVFGNDDRDVSKQDLSQLVYTEAVLKETLRVHPIIPVTARIIDQDLKLKNCTLSKGRTCFTFYYGMHRHPSWGADAEEFKPERWLNPSTLPDNPSAFAAFHIGRRTCIGKTYALMSTKVSLVHLMRTFKVFGDDSELKLKIDVMLKPHTGYHISLENRNSL